MEAQTPEVIKVNDQLRSDLVLAFVRRRAARAEMGEAQAVVERLIQKLDKDGELTVAIKQAGHLTQVFNQADMKLSEVVAAVQKEAGVPLAGYSINAEDGTLRKAPVAPTAPAEPVQVEAKVLPMKPKKAKKSKK